MPPNQKLPGWLGEEPPEDFGEEPPEDFGEDPPEDFEEEDDAEEADGDDTEPYFHIASLDDLAAFVAHPEGHRNCDTVFVVGVPFRDAPLMLERLRGAPLGRIQFVGNLDCLQRTSDLHAGLSRLLGSLGSLHNRLRDDGSIDWVVVATIEDAPPRLVALCGEQQDSISDSALTLIGDVREMLGALPDKTEADPKYPSELVGALVSRVGDLLQGIDALLLGGVFLEYPRAEDATFLAMRNEGAQEEEQLQQQRYILRIQGRQDLSSVLDEPHRYFLQDMFRFADAPSMFKDLRKASDEKGWWVGNIDRLAQASLLYGRVTRISRSVGYVLMGLQGNEIDWSGLHTRAFCHFDRSDW